MSEDSATYYDKTDPSDIERFARRLVGMTLRDALEGDAQTRFQAGSGKGNFGVVVERSYFGLDVGSSPEPDFAAAGVELKCTPLREVRGRLRAKERLVMQMIDFDSVTKERWETSSFLKKCEKILLIFYRWIKDADPLDYRIEFVRLWSIPKHDLPIIKEDWHRVIAKILAGNAHQISESDTNYLAACTKGSKGTDRRRQPFSDELAKPRAWSFKPGYMNSIIDESMSGHTILSNRDLESGKSLETLISERFEPYYGMTATAIADKLGVDFSGIAKGRYAALTKQILSAILGTTSPDRAAEFRKADVIPRTIRLKKSGMPKEAVSFPAFDYSDLVSQEWDESDFRADLSKRFFFVIYDLKNDDEPVLRAVRFWGMAIAHVDGPAQECFNETKRRILAGQATSLPSTKENPVCHVRPHGKDGNDRLLTPAGELVVRKSFWLNQKYLKRVLSGLLSSN